MGSHCWRFAGGVLCALSLSAHLRADDCNGNGTSDASDVLTGRSRDCNGNGVPDECDLAASRFEFAPPQSMPIGLGPSIIAAADVNRDGSPDLVAANPYLEDSSSSTLTFFPNDGTGKFSLVTTLLTGSVPSAVAIADLNSDGKEDLISANSASRDLSVLLNRGKEEIGRAHV